MAKSIKNVIVSGYLGFDNFGDEAIFYALSNHLKTLNISVSALCANNKKYDEIKTYNYKKPLDILKGLIKTDALISGGGSLLQNKTSNFSLFYYLGIIAFAKLLFKKVIIFAQGFEPIKGKIPTIITKFVLKTADFISVRDQKSVDYLKSLKIDSILVSDPAYSLVQDKKPDENKEGLVVQLRDYKGIDEKFLNALSSSIAKNYKGKVQVLSLQDKIDLEVCEKFIVELKKNNLEAELISNKTIDEVIDILNKAQFLISTRLHALITAIPIKTNVFAIKYDDKIETICEELNISNIDILNYKEDELDNKLNAFFNHHLNEVHPFRHFNWECIDNYLKK